MARRLQFFVLILLAIGAGLWWWSRQHVASSGVWQGYADADYVKVGPTQQGLLTAVSVGRGDQVESGALLFT